MPTKPNFTSGLLFNQLYDSYGNNFPIIVELLIDQILWEVWRTPASRLSLLRKPFRLHSQE